VAVRKKGAVRKGYGAMCNICGLNCGKGGPLKKHIEGRHPPVTYEAYKACFYPKSLGNKILTNAWDDSVQTSNGSKAVVHVLVRRFIQDKDAKSVTRSVPRY